MDLNRARLARLNANMVTGESRASRLRINPAGIT